MKFVKINISFCSDKTTYLYKSILIEYFDIVVLVIDRYFHFFIYINIFANQPKSGIYVCTTSVVLTSCAGNWFADHNERPNRMQ